MNWLIIGAIIIVLVFVINRVQNTRSGVSYYIVLGMLLFFSVSLYYIDNKYNLNLASFDGFVQAGRIYYSWGASLFHNAANVGGYVVKQDWGLNTTNLTAVK